MPDDDDDDDDIDRTKMGVEPFKLEGVPSERDRPYLIVLAGSNVGEMYRIEDAETIIGRAEDVTIKLGDDGISRKHVRVTARGQDAQLEDLGSVNGTLVNGQRVTKVSLKDGDKIQIGSTTILKFTYHDKLEENFRRQMYDAALRDGLTKLFNKKHFMDRIESELSYARRHAAQLSLVMMDVDHFKKVNDTYGHLAGDMVLSTLATAIQSALRGEDLLARYGGEEFVILCRGSSAATTGVAAERVRARVQGTAFVFSGKTIPITVSLGVAAYVNGQTSTQLISAADAALYEAKHAGRNRVVVR